MGYESHPNLVTPPDGTVVLRYVDFWKFVDLLENQRLWFTRADRLDDPREGDMTEAELKKIRNAAPPEVAEANINALTRLLSVHELRTRELWWRACFTVVMAFGINQFARRSFHTRAIRQISDWFVHLLFRHEAPNTHPSGAGTSTRPHRCQRCHTAADIPSSGFSIGLRPSCIPQVS
jgi:hypothetical protein